MKLFRNEQSRLVFVDPAGQTHAGVEPVRCFPISLAEQWISLCNAEGHELACIEDPASLPDELRTLIFEELARNEFVPVITRIDAVADESEFASWRVKTDRGPVHFRINGEDAIRRLDQRRVMVVDAAGIRYQIPDIAALDRSSRRLLDRFI